MKGSRMRYGGGVEAGGGGRLSEGGGEIWQWKDLGRCGGGGGGVDRQTGVSKRGCGVATLATEGASEVFCTTLSAGGRDC